MNMINPKLHIANEITDRPKSDKLDQTAISASFPWNTMA
jgi:hypothetical protein